MQFKEYTIKADKQSRRKSTTMYLTTKEKKQLITECGDAGLILMDYYYSKAGVPNFEYTDNKSATALGWTERKVQTSRLKLTKNHWYYEASGRYSDGRFIKTFYLGKETVTSQKEIEHKDFNSNPLEEK